MTNILEKSPWLRALIAHRARLEIEGEALAIDDRRYRIDEGIVRFRESDGYNDTFALQWKRFRETQLDIVNGTGLSRKRFAETGWDLSALRDATVLEAGSGAGRFTRILGEAGARLVTFDYSSAVDANFENNGGLENVLFCQADIFDMPFRDDAFDYVFCHGVLQHTPDPRAAFEGLASKVKPGGRISIDIYRRDFRIRPWKSKRIWRPLTTRMKPETLLGFLDRFIPAWLPVDTAIKRLPRVGVYLGSIVPCWNYWYTDLSDRAKLEWAIMDTFDALAPKYDIPASLDEVRRWFEDRGLAEIEVREGGNGVVGNARKPA